jgi:hypothetical protein
VEKIIVGIEDKDEELIHSGSDKDKILFLVSK